MDPTLTPENFNFPEDDNLDLKRYLALFISNWYWFAVALFFALTTTYTINRYSEKVWTVSSTLLIKDDQLGGAASSTGSIVPGGDIFRSQQNLKNEMGILRSFMLNYKVMKELNDFHVVYIGVGRRGIVESPMYKKSPFKVFYDSLELQPTNVRVRVEILSDTTFWLGINGNPYPKREMKFGERYNEQGFDFTIEPRIKGSRVFGYNSSNNYSFYFTDPENLANEYRSKLYVGPIEKEASLVVLSVSGVDPEQESDYLNKLMDVYIKYGREFKTETATNTIEFIEKQIRIISDSLKITERDMALFRKNNNYFDPSREGTIIQNKLETFDTEKARFELQLQYYNYLSEYLVKKNVGETIISPSVIGITDPILLGLVNKLSEMNKEIVTKGFNFENNQPTIELMDRQAEETREALKENVNDGISGIKLSISELDKKIAVIENELRGLPGTEMEFVKVQRGFDINNTVYTYLLEKRAETGIARASIVSDNRKIDSASQYMAGLVKPKARKNFIVALILGFLLPMISIILIDFFNDKIIDKHDIEKKTKVPVIGYISHSEGKNEVAVVGKPTSALAESFRAIRTALKYYMKENEKPVIAISSTISSEGKTFISINLAAITAMLGKKVLLIGLDLRKPRINKVLEFAESPGMSTYLSGNCKYDDVIRQTQIKNLWYAPSGPIPPNPSELIETELMSKFMKVVKKDFDFIIIDTPPVAIVTDALLLTQYVDINLFIVRQRYSSRSTLDIIEQLYRHGKVKNMAIIINDINLSGYYGYGMRYGYSLGYGYSYGYNYYGKGYYGRYGYSDKHHGYYTDEA